jgi:phage replication-related protein YjqB (UPF0714/DUF867 family)
MGCFLTFGELSRHAVEGRDFSIDMRFGRSGVAIMAPHGGGIEPGTDMIAAVIAGHRHGFYAFKGLRIRGNRNLHLSSECFDEPRGLALARKSLTVVTIHGCNASEEVVYVGGLDQVLRDNLIDHLQSFDFKARKSSQARLGGIHPENLCNRCRKGQGVQMELSGSLRQNLLPNLQHGRPRTDSASLKTFVAAFDRALKYTARRI